MSFPASLTTRVVTSRFVTYPDGAPATGKVRFVLVDYLQGPKDHAFVAPFDVTIDLVDGEFSAVLPATDDPDWSSSRYRVTVTIDGKALRKTINIPSYGSGTLDLSDLIGFEPSTPPSFVTLYPSSILLPSPSLYPTAKV